ncbi:DUF4252 domain-containing protein [Nonlabens ponticola]|uniref:DUF4252 domain-containing protein n=1 Tax=Nonlabens ponticola TaxID=2496866 RepID=A0A3S9MYC8_9FLAO|nr:DUF4252 domain-containing protein [Nonlabens ponticola]AZQ44158.1 DUF4252 domain-containing protein [Nonlabens ponticola]
MNRLIFKVIALSLVALSMLTSCEKPESLQQYYLNSQEKDGFITSSIPKGIMEINTDNMSDEAQNAYNSIDKVNVLALPVNEENRAQYDLESVRLNNVFANEDYKLLMSHNSDSLKIKMMYDGTQNAIDEIIVYGNSPKMGLGVARVIGDDMNVAAIMEMLKELENDKNAASNIEGLLGDMGISTSDISIDPK